MNGSLNLPRESLSDQVAIARRQGRDGASFESLLDRHGVDVFLGVRLPQVPKPERPWIYTTGHLEAAPGWIPVFRTPQDAVYLRRDERNAENLARVAAYYAREGVPFDPERGFDPGAALAAAPAWALAHGIAPEGHRRGDGAGARAGPGASPRGARPHRRARHRARPLRAGHRRSTSGCCFASPSAIPPARRLVWSLLRLGRLEEARETARPLLRTRGLAAAVAEAALAADADPDARAAQLARLPVFTPAEARRVVEGIRPAPTRPWRE